MASVVYRLRMRKMIVGLVVGAALVAAPGLAPAEAALPKPRLRYLAWVQMAPSNPTTARANMIYQVQLHDLGTPIVGRTIRFTSGAVEVCSAVTDTKGWARCLPSSPTTTALAPTVARATFDGDSTWAATYRDQQFFENTEN